MPKNSDMQDCPCGPPPLPPLTAEITAWWEEGFPGDWNLYATLLANNPVCPDAEDVLVGITIDQAMQGPWHLTTPNGHAHVTGLWLNPCPVSCGITADYTWSDGRTASASTSA